MGNVAHGLAGESGNCLIADLEELSAAKVDGVHTLGCDEPVLGGVWAVEGQQISIVEVHDDGVLADRRRAGVRRWVASLRDTRPAPAHLRRQFSGDATPLGWIPALGCANHIQCVVYVNERWQAL